MPPGFQYHPDILTRFPVVCGGVILLQDFTNCPSPFALLETYLAEQSRVAAQIGEKPLSEIPALAAWRGAFRQFGVDPTKYRSAAESLLRRLTKKGDIPSINSLVDLCNLISIRWGLPVAAFDLHQLAGPITVHFASGSETFTPHDTSESEQPSRGEVIFSDPSNLVLARRWCWKQSVKSAVDLETTDAIITIEAQHPAGKTDIHAALNLLKELLEKFLAGNIQSGMIDTENPSFIG